MNKSRLSILLTVLLLTIILSGCTDDTEKDNDDNQQDVEKQVFIAIHCEPGSFPNRTDYQNDKWPHLIKLVKSADEHDHKLTILLNPQWATYILENSNRLELIRLWEKNGHEIGLHSHGPSQGNWNGYTDKTEFQDHPKYIGNIANMMTLMEKIPQTGKISTAAVTDNDQDMDYPSNIPYDVDGGWNGKDDLVSTPEKVTINGVERTQLHHARYYNELGTGGEINVPLADIGESIDDLSASQVMGIVFHAFEYKDRPKDYDELLHYLDKDKDIRTRTVSTILG